MTIAASDATLGYVDEANVYYYDAAWRLLEERVDDGAFTSGTQPSETDPFDGLAFAADRVVQRVWGLEYIDELLFVMEDGDENEDGDGDMNTGAVAGRHAVVDRLYSVVGLLDEQAQLLERVRYSAYGVARQHSVALADVNGDGVTNAADLNSVNTAFGLTLADANYNVDADFDGNGVIDFGNDYNAVLNGFGEVGAPAGQVSQKGNTVGYAGYLFDPATAMYLARFRWYEPEIGRWITRDPIEYIDGTNLYEYVKGSPLGLWDPFGLQSIAHPGGAIQTIIASLVAQGKTAAEIAAALAALGFTAAMVAEYDDTIAEVMRRAEESLRDAVDRVIKDKEGTAKGRSPCEGLASMIRQLEKANRSEQKNIDEHEGWINDPCTYKDPIHNVDEAIKEWKRQNETRRLNMLKNRLAIERLKNQMQSLGCK